MITVIIPAYNCEKYIRQALDSAVRQTISRPLDILVIDDCSEDKTGEVVTSYIAEFEKENTTAKRQITYIRNETNLGVAETRNIGIRKARGEYIALLDGDDWWSPEKLERQDELIREKQAVLVYTGRELMEEDGKSTGKIISVPLSTDYEALLRTNCIPCSSVLMKTKIAREFYMCHDELHEDYILWLNMLQKYGNAYGIDEPYLKSRMVMGGKSRNKLKSAKMHFGVYRYMKIPMWKAVWLFICYALNGVKKYR